MSRVADLAMALAKGPVDKLTLDQVPGFIDSTRRATGWPVLPLPIYVHPDLEVPGSANAQAMHLRQQDEYDPYVVLHELAHHLTRQPHTPKWAATFIELVNAGISPRHGNALRRAFRDFRVVTSEGSA